jgi:hypothetical protein
MMWDGTVTVAQGLFIYQFLDSVQHSDQGTVDSITT